jgi:hypothetical protein
MKQETNDYGLPLASAGIVDILLVVRDVAVDCICTFIKNTPSSTGHWQTTVISSFTPDDRLAHLLVPLSIWASDTLGNQHLPEQNSRNHGQINQKPLGSPYCHDCFGL